MLEQAGGLAAEMLAAGTTTFECKSGYGLSREGELRSLALARSLGERVTQTTTSTALLAHAAHPGSTPPGGWIKVAAMLPEVMALGSVTALDIFVESIAFANDDLERMGALATPGGGGAALPRRAVRLARFGPGGAGRRRPLGGSPIDAPGVRRGAAGRGRVRGGAAAGGRVPGCRAPCARTGPGGRRGADRAGLRRQSGDGAGRLDAGRAGAGRPAVWVWPPGAAGGRDPERGLDARAGAHARLDRGRQARRPAGARLARGDDPLPVRP